MPHPDYTAYEPAAPYFDLIRSALGDLVDGGHFFDILTEDTLYEVLYDIPGWPRVIRGRTALMSAFLGYVGGIALHSAEQSAVHRTNGADTVIVEYQVHGTILGTGVRYDNRFCSVIVLRDRKIAHWRDYMDSLAAWNALTASGR